MLQQLLKPYQQYGNLHYGEGVTELAHALQTAYLAQKAGDNESMIAAALLHDYGHLVHGLGENIAEQGVDDLLDIEDMTEERAAELIMTARAPWFAEEEEATA